MATRARLRILAALLLAASAAGILALACGSSGDDAGPAVDEAGGGQGVVEAGPDGASNEAGTGGDAAAAADGGRGDADAALAVDAACPTGAPGTLDTSFGDNGFFKLKDDAIQMRAIATQPDGKLVLGGTNWVGEERTTTVVRLLPDGTFDTSFGTGGIAMVKIGPKMLTPRSLEAVYAVAIQPDGKIISAGYAQPANVARGGRDFSLARFLADGTLDATFGTGGVTLTDFNGREELVQGVTIHADGRIVAAGSSGPYPDGDVAVARYATNGSLDTTFGVGGRALLDFRGTHDDGTGIVATADGRTVVAAQTLNPDAGTSLLAEFGAVRLTLAGALDPSFGDAGRFISSFGPSFNGSRGLVMDDANRFLIAGALASDVGLIRLTASGSLDPSFADAGAARAAMGNGLGVVPLFRDGRVIVAAHAFSSGGQHGVGLVKYLSTGAPDVTFGVAGMTMAFPPLSSPTTSFNPTGAATTRCFTYVAGDYLYTVGTINMRKTCLTRFFE